MFLRKLAEKRKLTIFYCQQGTTKTIKGELYSINIKEQTLSILDEQQKVFCLPLSEIKQID
ncbi:hypothetical protein [Bacillus sp. B15-48]|uniref:hypothetical protein n=1 Tax=Bacillus sp. B15-48 TaxID=1548601 RepID=UPI00193EE187|nr:hypothetical protein [Bacillus sp. B15-48]MBM4763275.1 hypothetical protein [Bacillus sp. B15-48]